MFRARNGRRPFEEWLDALDDQRAVARVLARLARVRQGNLGDCKPVGEGVSELRVDYGPATAFISVKKGGRWSCCSAAATSGRKTGTSGWRNYSGTSLTRANDENGKL